MAKIIIFRFHEYYKTRSTKKTSELRSSLLAAPRGIFSARHDFVEPAQPGVAPKAALARFRRRSLRRNRCVAASSLQPVRFPAMNYKRKNPTGW
jgi:hypothetical protein